MKWPGDSVWQKKRGSQSERRGRVGHMGLMEQARGRLYLIFQTWQRLLYHYKTYMMSVIQIYFVIWKVLPSVIFGTLFCDLGCMIWVKELVVLGGDAVNNPEQRWNELRVPGCSLLPYFCFCFFQACKELSRSTEINLKKYKKFKI